MTRLKAPPRNGAVAKVLTQTGPGKDLCQSMVGISDMSHQNGRSPARLAFGPSVAKAPLSYTDSFQGNLLDRFNIVLCTVVASSFKTGAFVLILRTNLNEG